MPGKGRKRTLRNHSSGGMRERETVSQQPVYTVTRRLVLEELDTEIRMRRRLRETIESRIAWATRLQSSLSTVTEGRGPGTKSDISHANPFQFAAADALIVAEAPLLPILSREARFPSLSTPEANPAPVATPSTNPYARPHTRHTRLRRSPSTFRPAPKLLYIRDSATNAIARLACPDCARGDFPRVQSLLNHCRLQHGREFGSHDECIRGCAVQVPTDEEAWVFENGSELKNVSLPSLQRLFEIAVGSVTGPLENAGSNDTSAAQRTVSQEDVPISELETPPSSAPILSFTSTHLSRTLGHHAETPALAPFLGRAPKRRGITVHDENAPVDIDGLYVDVTRQWRKPLTHRSRARPALDVTIPIETSTPQLIHNVTPVTQGTRFHIVTRITVSDRSLWIPIDRRLATVPEHTHRWWLSIEAPTYSLPLGAVLERATVTCLSSGASPSPALDVPLEVSGPPFFVGGTTAHPFLVRLRLEWASGSLNPPHEVEHWVELDLLHVGTPVLGDEQVLDVELDRNTALRRVPQSTLGLDPSLDPWNFGSESSRAQAKPAPASPEHIVLLRSLVPKYPLTLRDLKSKVSCPLPYKLVSSPAHFRALVPGRRKAIEWARARALREAYEEIRREQAPREGLPQLGIGDVFMWLADTGSSLRPTLPPSAPAVAPTGKRISERITPSVANEFCPACGLDSARHPPRPRQSLRLWEGPSPSHGSSCPFSFSSLTRLPLLDVGPISYTYGHPEPDDSVHYAPVQQKHPFHWPWPIQKILAASDPTLISAVSKIIDHLKLSCFQGSQSVSTFGDGVLRSDRKNTEGTASTAINPMVVGTEYGQPDNALFSEREREIRSLGASAIIALAVRGFARQLLQSTITALSSDRMKAKGNLRAVLTPAHLARGVAGSRNVILADLPTSPVALSLSTLVQRLQSTSSPLNAVMETSQREVVPPVGSLSHCVPEDG